MKPRDLSEIVSQIESIGRNCEFGFVQRDLGADPTSLLRWAGTPRAGLIAGLKNRFAGLAEEMTGRAEPPNREPAEQFWWLTCKRYGILFHTGERVTTTTVEQATVNVRQRLRWLAAKLIDDIRDGEKLFVFSDATMSEPDEALDLISAMRGLGGSAWLWSIAQSSVDAGGTLPLSDGLIGSWMAKLTEPGDAVSFQAEPWRAAIGEAYGIWRRQVEKIMSNEYRFIAFDAMSGNRAAHAGTPFNAAYLGASDGAEFVDVFDCGPNGHAVWHGSEPAADISVRYAKVYQGPLPL